MKATLDINKLNFGSDDAELDERHGFLDKVFLKTSIYVRTKEAKRELILGRKGSGKSAIFLMLKKVLQSDGFSVISITPHSLSHQKSVQLKMSSLNDDESSVLSWKYVLLVKVALEVLSQAKKPSSKEQKKLLKLIRKFLVENGEIDKNFFQKLSRSLNIFSKLSVIVLGTGVAWEKQQLSKLQKDPADELNRFQTRIETILTLLKRTRIFVLIDKVDELWKQTKESQTMIIGLINATHDLNSILHDTNIILFLRSDIYDELTFSDSDHLHGLEERLNWYENDLKHLIANRGKVSANLDLEDDDELWNTIFEMNVKGESSFQYILKRTMKRPRELIQFCNNALSEAQNNNHKHIFVADILQAERQYSDWKLKDLESEFFVQYPYLKELLGLFQGFRAVFSWEEFNTRYQEAQTILIKYPVLQTISTDTMLQILFIIGFLGARRENESIFVFDHSSVVLAQEKRIVIHPAFQWALGLQQTTFITGSIQDIVVGDYNVVGNIHGGGTVSNIFYDSETTTMREIDKLQKELSELTIEQNIIEKRVESFGPNVSSRLETELKDIRANIARIIIQIGSLEPYLASNQNTQGIRDSINTIKSKVVLILGRFTPERKEILDALRDVLRIYDYLPLLFDFEKPSSLDFNQTILALARMSRFIIADLTDLSSIPLELQEIVQNIEIPVQPLLLEGKREYSMFVDLRKYHLVLPIHLYKDQASLIVSLKNEIIEPADKKARELAIEKAKRLGRP